MTVISVVIPCKNDAVFLERCLAALANQTRAADEIIVVDSTSIDNTKAVGEAAGARVITRSLDGILAATAVGFDEARGDVIARLDADSIPPADWLQRIEHILSHSSEFSAVTGPGDFYDASNRFVAWFGRMVYLGGYFWTMTALLGHSPLFGSNFAMHATIWARVGSYVHRHDRCIHDDLDISYHLEPDMTVIYDSTLRVGISARPFDSWRSFGRRLSWAYITFRVNFRERSPLKRLGERRRWVRQKDRQSACA
jgi:glycosyltransferase involved in cell wall biosynthesis